MLEIIVLNYKYNCICKGFKCMSIPLGAGKLYQSKIVDKLFVMCYVGN